ncbi:hypothetical protein CLOM_g19590 [Closterium sp. NIES-68]|nr:hypothetical protein CLOM_g19590 [Closterium sp. NIES-68]GJP83496.1 hypothetical protein CLOP_g13642 [Closterium sp. NIES-67]
MPPAVVDKEAKEALAKDALAKFVKIGLDEKTAQNAVANAKVTANLVEVIKEAQLEDGCDKAIGNLVYTVATKFPANARVHRPTLLSYVTSQRIKTVPQLEAAHAYLATVGQEPLNIAELEAKSGVGVEVTLEDIKAAVTEAVSAVKEKLVEERYRFNLGLILAKVRSLQPWADGKLAKEEVDAQVLSLLGPKTEADDAKPLKKKKEKKPKGEDSAAPAAAAGAGDKAAGGAGAGGLEGMVEESDPYAIFPNPQDNNIVHTEVFFSDGTTWRPKNSREALEKHLAVTGGKVWSRFPPEPNGYLHIGHAKAMYVDFGLAKDRDGNCYLRYDDTNPEAEKQEYIDHIEEIVAWLGWKPFKITYSSDYFQELYDLAVLLIKRGYAYVDHQTAEEIKEHREKHLESPWRNRPIEESLQLFENMRRGLVDEGAATLRMKQDMRNENPNMWDLIAYRIKFTPHPHVGDKWCIYPSYDYTHCIIDSLENITHSLCTLEFETRRASYYWLLEALGLYHPYVWEYARLNITHTMLSKRKLNRLVMDHHVNGWDDPRLMTLSGLRRRGADPAAINAFCRAVGITRNENVIRVELLEHFMRDHLNRTAPRSLVVLKPLKVVITNVGEEEVEMVEGKRWPDAKEGDLEATYKLPFSRVVYIEQSDFREKDSKDYYGLAPNKSVMLRYAYPIKCTEVIYEEDGTTVKELRAECDRAKSTKPKGVIHWVAEPKPGQAPLTVTIRLINKLFLSENPNELDDWLGDLNPESMEVIEGALAEPTLAGKPAGSTFQFERLGYFCVDTDSTDNHLVFNRTVTLKESYPKFGAK